jgi:hypothetical protein
MRLFCLAVILAVSAAQKIQSQTPADEEVLKNRIATHERASAENDLRGLVDVYSRDAEMISASGAITRAQKQRSAIG